LLAEPIFWQAAVFSHRLNLFSHGLQLFSLVELAFWPLKFTIADCNASHDDTEMMNWTWKEASVPRFKALPSVSRVEIDWSPE
jgi:hypothetical protein